MCRTVRARHRAAGRRITAAYHGGVSSPAPENVPEVGPSPLLSRRGAVATPDDETWRADTGLAWHFGDPFDEQRAAGRGAVLLDRWTSGEITVTGADRLTWLHTLSSQQLADLGDGGSTEALWLSPQGHVEHWADVTELAGTVHLRTEPGTAAPLLEFLRSMTFWSHVDLADVTAERSALTVAGPGAAAIVATVVGTEAGPVVGTAAGPPRLVDGRAVAVTDGPAAGGWLRGHADSVDLVLPREAHAAVAGALIRAGATPAGSWAAAALRIPARRPRFGVDNDQRTIPNETGWLTSAVHLHKGCYRGQETVARVDNLGQPPRRLVMLHLDGSSESLPAPGDPVCVSDTGRAVGRVGTVAQHFEDGPVALALVKRSVGPGAALLAGGVDAMIDPDDAVTDGRPFSVERGTFHDFRRH